MTDNALSLSVVVPAYNEGDRIADSLSAVFTFLDAWMVGTEVIVVDDGSTDATAALLARFAAKHPRLRILTNARNLGKGASIKRGMLAAAGEHVFFIDADLSVPIDELATSHAAMVRHGHPILIGSRRTTGAQLVRRQPWLRESLGQGFTWLTRALLGVAIVDFTCGFKGFRRDVAQLLFTLQRRNDWAFDAEILYLAKLLGVRVHQQPVRWSHRDGSRVRFPRDLVRTLAGLVAIRAGTARAVSDALGALGPLPEETRQACVNLGSFDR